MNDAATVGGERGRPEVAVVVPVYNVAPWLRDCLDSVRGQTFAGWDCVCVDDGSTDGSGAICDEYAAGDPRFHVLHQGNAGLSAARNAALDWIERHPAGGFVTFLDSDDWLAPNALEEMLRGAATGDGVAAFPFQKVDSGAHPSGGTSAVRWSVLPTAELWASKSIVGSTACGKVFPIRLFSGIRFPVGRLHEDEWTTHRVLFRTERAALADAPLYFYRQRADSIMHAPFSDKRIRDALESLDSQVDFFLERRQGRLAARSAKLLVRVFRKSLATFRECGSRNNFRHCLRVLRGSVRKGRLALPANDPAYRAAWPVRAWVRGHLERLLGSARKA